MLKRMCSLWWTTSKGMWNDKRRLGDAALDTPKAKFARFARVVAQGRAVAETIETARDISRKLIEAQRQDCLQTSLSASPTVL
jgi:hypothetical protein